MTYKQHTFTQTCVERTPRYRAHRKEGLKLCGYAECLIQCHVLLCCSVGRTHPHIVDVDWRLDYCLKVRHGVVYLKYMNV